MDSFEFNKIAGAILGSVLFLMIIGKVSSALIHPHVPEHPHIAVQEEAVATEPSNAPPQVPPLPAGGEAAAGQVVFQKICSVCHTADKGGAKKVGPNLFGVVGRKPGTAPGFDYTKCMAEKGAKEPEWTDEALNAFLFKPAADCKGTKMAMAGLKDKDRADVIAFLKSLK